jgi:hypothetical protein
VQHSVLVLTVSVKPVVLQASFLAAVAQQRLQQFGAADQQCSTVR